MSLHFNLVTFPSSELSVLFRHVSLMSFVFFCECGTLEALFILSFNVVSVVDCWELFCVSGFALAEVTLKLLADK